MAERVVTEPPWQPIRRILSHPAAVCGLGSALRRNRESAGVGKCERHSPSGSFLMEWKALRFSFDGSVNNLN